MSRKELFSISLVSIALITVLDLFTNSIDTSRNTWDFIYYIALAKDGFHATLLASPFAYRYLTPGLVHLLTLTGLTIGQGFQLIAYFGAFTQLTGIYIFTKWATKSKRGAWLAMMFTAFSLFNVKFLLFDIYRPDHFAYVLILIQTYFAFERKFLPLLILTIIASQIREFNIVPLLAYFFMLARDTETSRTTLAKQGIISTISLLPAIVLPRILIPVTENYQIIGLNIEGIVNAIVFPFIPSVSVNFIFAVTAYFLPLALHADPRDLRMEFNRLSKDRRVYLLTYTILILTLTILGGTDINRFVTFLFLPQIILIGMLADRQNNGKLVFIFICLFLFNRLWSHFPDWDVEKYRDFYGGFALQLNINTVYRILELTGFLLLGILVRKMRFFDTRNQGLEQ